ncbi:MAG: glycine-rich domain-containing protein [Bdellovibrionales bacterium]
MTSFVGNILPPSLSEQVSAIRSTARTLDRIQLQLATGKKIFSALNNPNNFFTSQALDNRASDLSRLLDGIGQSVRTIELASDGIETAIDILDTAEAYVTGLRDEFAAGTIAPVDVGSSNAVAIAAQSGLILATRANAIDLGGGLIVEIFNTAGSVTFTPPQGVTDVEYLVVAGGGGGGSSTTFSTAGSGGGGAGGVITGSISISGADLEVTVGGGGAAGLTGNNSGFNGDNSSFATNDGSNIVAIGGGGGIGGNGSGNNGGSGGGGRGGGGGVALQPLSPQGGLGNQGGGGPSPGGFTGSGGGGAGGPGGGNSATIGGAGGDGFETLINGTPFFVGGGGGGGGANNDDIGLGGDGGGGDGGNDTTAPTAGQAGTGGGGGGGNNNRLGAAGGSGLVILRYQLNPIGSTTEGRGEEYSRLLDQLDELVIDANYRGINLLDGEDLTTFFNENLTSRLVTEGIDGSSLGLGLNRSQFLNIEQVELALDEIDDAREELRAYGSTLAIDISIIQTREIFTLETINSLESGADDLTLLDQNEAGTAFLALQTRQQIQFSTLSLASQTNSFITALF